MTIREENIPEKSCKIGIKTIGNYQVIELCSEIKKKNYMIRKDGDHFNTKCIY